MSYYPIELDKIRNLRYGMKAISLVEKKLKKPISKVDMNSLTMEDTAILIWSGLAHEDKTLSPDRVMDLVDEYSSLTKVMENVSKALEEAFGTEEENKSEKNE